MKGVEQPTGSSAIRSRADRTCADLSGIEKKLDADVLRQMAMRLSLPEIIALQNATRAREAGLATLRAGRSGAMSLQAARELLETELLGDEARTIGLSYQEAAEALLDYCDGRHDVAIDRLENALEYLAVLADRFGHDVTVRRAHIAHNILTVMRVGRRSDSITLAKAFLYWVQRKGDWPLPRSRCSHEPPLGSVEKDLVVDQLAAELFRFGLATRTRVDAEGIAHIFDAIDLSLGQRISLLGSAVDLNNADRRKAARAAASRYLKIGCGNLPRLWAIAGIIVGDP